MNVSWENFYQEGELNSDITTYQKAIEINPNSSIIIIITYPLIIFVVLYYYSLFSTHTKNWWANLNARLL